MHRIIFQFSEVAISVLADNYSFFDLLFWMCSSRVGFSAFPFVVALWKGWSKNPFRDTERQKCVIMLLTWLVTHCLWTPDTARFWMGNQHDAAVRLCSVPKNQLTDEELGVFCIGKKKGRTTEQQLTFCEQVALTNQLCHYRCVIECTCFTPVSHTSSSYSRCLPSFFSFFLSIQSWTVNKNTLNTWALEHQLTE